MSTLRAVAADGRSITFEYSGDRAAQALRRAQLYCANLGRGAEMRVLTQVGDAWLRAQFDCR